MTTETNSEAGRLAVFAAGEVAHVAQAPAGGGAVIDAALFEDALAAITAWPGYRPTPLHDLPALAGDAGVGTILYKDEGPRFGLKSFKALGGAYAVQALVQAHGGDGGGLTVCCATDGNHGRSVAWGAGRFGCRCLIYLHAEVSAGREAAIAAYGAEIVRVDGNYDASVRAAARDAEANGWHVISDTSYAGYSDIPRQVMAGYGVIAEEIAAEIGDGPLPTHAFLQGGVGGFAAALAICFRNRWREAAPRLVVVEPALAACLLRSAEAGAVTEVLVEAETLMAGLSCGVPSLLAWDVLRAEASDFLAVPESFVVPAMRLLARPIGGDPAIEAGESAVAGLAGLLGAASRPEQAKALGLDKDSRVLVVGTEGATDPALYAALIGAG
jgi:diaminopropionate ammonia-lyase